MKPIAWVITWQAHGAEPAGSQKFVQRARARGFLMIRRAAGFVCGIQPVFKG